jgi:amylosucrase
VFGRLVQLGAVRAQLPALHAAGVSTVLDVGSPHVLGWRRRHPRSGWFVGLANFAEHPVSIEARVLGSYSDLESVLSSDGVLEVQNGQLRLPGLGFVWLAEP